MTNEDFMTEINPAYTGRFAKQYAIVAGGIFIVFGLAMSIFPNLLSAPILRGALIGGSIGAIMWPIMAFAQSFLQAEGRKADSAEARRYAVRFARKALFVNLALGVVAIIVAFVMGGVRSDEIGIAFGVMVVGVAIGFGLQILMFRLFIWSAFKGAEKRAQRQQGG
jgi:uncharacterized membrane protein